MVWPAIIGGVIAGAGALAGGKLGSDAAEDAANAESAALLEQMRMSDRVSRDFLQTGIEYENEQRDLLLTGSEPYRNAGALALAGMMDMAGLDRGQLPAPGVTTGQPEPGRPGYVSSASRRGDMGMPESRLPPNLAYGPGGELIPNPLYTGPAQLSSAEGDPRRAIQRAVDAYNAVGGPQAIFDDSLESPGVIGYRSPNAVDDQMYNSAEAASQASYPGVSQYEAELDYDLDRLNDPARIVQSAEQYDFKTDPGYEFRLDETMRGLERSFSAGGAIKSGAYDRALMETAGNFASAEYGNVFNRLSTIAGFAPMGAASPGAGGAQIGNFGNRAVEATGGISAAGGARSQGQIGSANSWANAITQGAQAIGYGWRNNSAPASRGGYGSGYYDPYSAYSAASSDRIT